MGVVGLAENKANSAPIELELELGLSLAKIPCSQGQGMQRCNLSSKGWGGGGENNIRYGCEIFCLF